MAQLLLQQGMVPEALKYFERAAELSRTEGEIVHALQYAEATRVQLDVRFEEFFLRVFPYSSTCIGHALCTRYPVRSFIGRYIPQSFGVRMLISDQVAEKYPQLAESMRSMGGGLGAGRAM
jgi:hypothetical protein